MCVRGTAVNKIFFSIPVFKEFTVGTSNRQSVTSANPVLAPVALETCPWVLPPKDQPNPKTPSHLLTSPRQSSFLRVQS